MKKLPSSCIKKFMGIVLIIFTLVEFSYSQSTFQKTYSLQISGFAFDDVVRDVIIDSQENFVFAGYVKEFGSQGTQAFVYKTDKDGNLLWYKGYYDSIQNNNTSFTSIVQTNDMGYILSGYNPQDSGLTGGTYIKIDTSGIIQWIKKNPIGNDLGVMNKLVTATNGDIIGAGTVNNFSLGRLFDVTVVRFGSNGNFLWGKCFGTTGTEYGNDIISTSDNGFIIVGTSNQLFPPHGKDIYISKFDSSGNHIWSKIIGGNDEDGFANLTGVIETSDGNFIIVTPTKSFGFGDNDLFVLKIDNLGEIIWSNVYGTIYSDHPNSVIELSNGDILIGGGYVNLSINSSKAFSVRLDLNGNLLWSKEYNYLNFNGFRNVRLINNYYLFAGSTTSTGMSESTYVIKTDPIGVSGCNENNLLLSSANIGINSQNIPDSVFDRGSFVNGTISVYDYTTYFVENTLCFVGMEEYDAKYNIIIYPNPFQNEISISCIANTLMKSLEIFSVNGKSVYFDELDFTEKVINIETKNFPPGLYILKLINHQNQIYYEKIIKVWY